MTFDANPRPPNLRSQKRGDLVVEEIKRWIAERRLGPGDKLPKEDELQELFGVSKGTAREALKSLEVQGLVTVSTGPAGGATIGEVPLDRALQLLQNYLFFRELDVAQIYAVRRLLEPELAAGAVPHLTDEHLAALERSIETCAPHPASAEQALAQRQEDLHFHDVLAAANPNMLLRFMCQVINHLLRHSVAMGDPNHPKGHELGETNVAAHRRLLTAARRGDAEKVRKLMVEHVDEAERHVQSLAAAVRRRFVLESEQPARIAHPKSPVKEKAK
jgi:GntR family transcriptional regulator, transcriptional repressor for pyruvate dehydrogenase complex